MEATKPTVREFSVMQGHVHSLSEDQLMLNSDLLFDVSSAVVLCF